MATIHHYSEKLTLITLDPPLAGFDHFIGVWLYHGDTTFIVDVGPAVTVPALVKALGELQVTHLDYILLTHIHIDHAGGAGDFSPSFPDAPIICHPKGLPHLADPTHLWEGSLKTLGDTARAYGPIAPVPAQRLVNADTFHSDALTPLATPGHAPHHVSYLTPDYLFAGETGGVCLSLPDGRTWLRPATPPRFFLATALSSIDVLMDHVPGTICYGHLGVQNDAVHCLARHREQLLFWEKVIGREMTGSRHENHHENLIRRCLDSLLGQDPELAGYSGLTPAQRARETYFLTNSINGFIGYLKPLADQS